MAAVVSRPIVIAAAFPAVFMIFQLLPLPFLANPVWASLSAGFPHGITGSVSIDIGATVIALVRYLSALGAIVLAAAVAINRDRAESVLIGTAAAAALISFFALFDELFAFGFLTMREEALDCACLGVTLSAACALLVLERHEFAPVQVWPNPNQISVGFACLLGRLPDLRGRGRRGTIKFPGLRGSLWVPDVLRRRRDSPLESWTHGRRRDGRHCCGHRCRPSDRGGERPRPAVRLR